VEGKMKIYFIPTFILLVLLVALAIMFACDDDDDDDSGDDVANPDDDGDDDVMEEVWKDPESGLMWQLQLLEFSDWDNAKNHCKKLNYAGYTNWRLPSISELRSLIRGCSSMETGGDCGVTDDCLVDDKCYEGCSPCEYHFGPANGRYWPEEIEATKPFYESAWTSSIVLDGNENNEYKCIWAIDFSDAHLWSVLLMDDFNIKSQDITRCVRLEIAEE